MLTTAGKDGEDEEGIEDVCMWMRSWRGVMWLTSSDGDEGSTEEEGGEAGDDGDGEEDNDGNVEEDDNDGNRVFGLNGERSVGLCLELFVSDL